MVTHVFLIRHGRTAWNAEERLAGRLPGIGLNPLGRREAAAVADRLAGIRLSLVAASPLERTQETAAAIAQAHGLTVATDDAFVERDYPTWQGLLGSEIRARFPDEVRRVAKGEIVGGVESIASMANRMRAGMDRLVETHAGGALAIVSHADPIRALIVRILGMPATRLRWVAIDTGSLSRIHLHDGSPVVDYLNSRHHLTGLDDGGWGAQ